jgi:hypothetical protein
MSTDRTALTKDTSGFGIYDVAIDASGSLFITEIRKQFIQITKFSEATLKHIEHLESLGHASKAMARLKTIFNRHNPDTIVDDIEDLVSNMHEVLSPTMRESWSDFVSWLKSLIVKSPGARLSDVLWTPVWEYIQWCDALLVWNAAIFEERLPLGVQPFEQPMIGHTLHTTLLSGVTWGQI